MDFYHEDDAPDGKLFNREVLAMLLKYILVYKKYLIVSVGFVVVITASTLSVPAIARFVIDRLIVKQGTIASVGADWTRRHRDSFAYKEIIRGIRLSDSAYFIAQSRLSCFSNTETRLLAGQGVFSKEKYTLIDRPKLIADLAERLRRAVEENRAIRVSSSLYCIQSASLKRFSVNELLALRATDLRRVGFYVLLILGLFAVQFAASYLQIMALMRLSQKAMRDLRRDLFAHIVSLELSFFDKNPIGKLVNRITNDIEVLNELFSSVLITFIQDALILLGIVVIMFLANPALGCTVAITFPLLIIITIAFRVRARDAYRLIRTKIAVMNSFLNEHISGIRIVQIFLQELKQSGKFASINKGVYDANMKQIYVYGVFRPLIDFFRWFAIAGVIFIGAGLIAGDRVSYGLVVMFLSYIGTFFEPIGDLAEKFDTLQSATAAGEKILLLFKAPAAKETRAAPAIVVAAHKGGETNAAPLERLRGDIRFDDVWFSYTPGQWVLKGVSFIVPRNTTLAIVGETGSGKTTIANLLSRFYHLQKGGIYADGIDINDIPYHELRGSIGAVMQDVFLFSRTIAENVTLNSAFDEAAFERACRMSHCDTFIKALPSGREEMVMERGATFSTGQRQLLAIARALYFDPSILVLDEATSNIDTETESLIQDAIARLIKGRTSLIIAHRLSTIRSADAIIVLENGRIVERGDHRSLLAAKGMYYDLYKLQFEGV